eukprot:jgi/Psemu1/309514/fgenesh1_kg.518_\
MRGDVAEDPSKIEAEAAAAAARGIGEYRPSREVGSELVAQTGDPTARCSDLCDCDGSSIQSAALRRERKRKRGKAFELARARSKMPRLVVVAFPIESYQSCASARLQLEASLVSPYVDSSHQTFVVGFLYDPFARTTPSRIAYFTRRNTNNTAWASFIRSSVNCCIESLSLSSLSSPAAASWSSDNTAWGRIVSTSDKPTFRASEWMKRSSSKNTSLGRWSSSSSSSSFASLLKR